MRRRLEINKINVVLFFRVKREEISPLSSYSLKNIQRKKNIKEINQTRKKKAEVLIFKTIWIFPYANILGTLQRNIVCDPPYFDTRMALSSKMDTKSGRSKMVAI